MKSYHGLFPSYYCRDDHAAVFFESIESFNPTDMIESERDPNLNPNPNQNPQSDISYTSITGSLQLVTLLKRAKVVSNSFNRKTFEELRGKTNYYEGLGKGCFLNRSAMKLVNLDYVFSLIEPSTYSKKEIQDDGANCNMDQYLNGQYNENSKC
jgi:hypothetical protein